MVKLIIGIIRGGGGVKGIIGSIRVVPKGY